MKKENNSKFIVLWCVIMVAGTALMFIGIAHESIWYDESYTAALMNHSFADIITITGADSHPPLYYLLLRVFSVAFGRSIVSLRAFSVIGTAALAALGIGPVRRIYGKRFAVIYSFLVFALPISFSMSQEARMYTWSAAFVTASALFGYLAVTEEKRNDWIAFGITGLMAAYTHYYALLAAMIIYALVFLMMLIHKKKMKQYFITAGVVIMGYLPWLYFLTAQVKRVSNSFWIPPVNWYVIKNTLIYPFNNKFSYKLSPLFVDIAFYIAAALIVFGIVYRIVRKDEKGRMAVFAMSGYALTILAGVIASWVIRPVLVERYMMPVLGLFVLGLAYGISSLGKKILPIIACIAILALGYPQNQYTLNDRFNGPMNEAAEYVEERIQPGDVFVHTDEHTLGTFCYHFSDYNNYYYQKEGTGGCSNYDAFLPTGVMVNSIDEIQCDGNVWIIQRVGSQDTTSMKEWLADGKIDYAGMPKDFWIDPSWYRFTVYQMNIVNN